MNNKINIDLKRDTTDIKCEKCGHLYFTEVMRLKKLSKILTGKPEDDYIPLPLLKCEKCGHIKDELAETEQISN